jgi:deoxyribose-phosphate aldolase
MIDISAVQAFHGIAEIMEMVENAKRYGFISIHTLPCWIDEVRRLLPDTSGILVGGPIGFPSGGHKTDTKVVETSELLLLRLALAGLQVEQHWK